jgi:hypothetical protein
MALARSDLETRLRAGAPLVLDGATGTELERRGVATRLPLWSAGALDSDPELVRQIHADYVASGVDAVTANTFRTQRRTLAHAGIAERAEELTRRAVALARSAAGDRASFAQRAEGERSPSDSRALRHYFDAFFESSVLGLQKPDPRIYQHACAQLAISPSEAVFLDDIGRNLKAARALGMTTIKVETPEQALAELAGLVAPSGISLNQDIEIG